MRKTTSLAAMAALVGLGLSGCLQPIPNQSADANAGKAVAGKVSGVADKAYPVYTFYDEDFQQGGFSFVYGGSTKITQQEGVGAEGSEYFLHANLDVRDYSGVAVCLWNMQFDLTPYLATGALVFQARAKNGGEKVVVGLGDDEKSDGWKSVVRKPLEAYGTLKAGEWTTFVIPLRDFGKRGVAWDAGKVCNTLSQ